MTAPRQVEEANNAIDEFFNSLPTAPGDPNPEPTPEPKPEPTPEPKPPAEDRDQRIQALEDELARERHRNDSLEGRIRSQLKPAHDEVRTLRQELEDLRRQLNQAPKVPPHLRHLSTEEAERLDKDTLSTQARVAQGTAEAVVEQVRDEFKGRLDAQGEELRKQNVRLAWADVERLRPGATRLNQSDTDWHAFLDMEDPVYGVPRRELAEKALLEGRSIAVVTLLDAYLDTLPPAADPKDNGGGEPPPPAPAPETAPTPPRRPAPSAPSAPAAESPGRIWRQSEVKEFFDRYARGEYKDRPKVAEQIEKEIDLAATEGRIVSG